MTAPATNAGRVDWLSRAHAEAPGRAPVAARILVADDAPMIRMLVRRSLEAHHVVEVPDGQQALTMLRKWRPDLAILDWMMPGLTGLEVCQAARSDPALNGTILAVMTGLADLDAEEHARLAGVDHFLRKPILPRRLTALVEQALDQLYPGRREQR